MGRPSKSWQLRFRREQWFVRFSHEGRQREFATGESSRKAAEEQAKEIYVSVVSGAARRIHVRGDLSGVAAEWLTETESERDPDTSAIYEMQLEAHLVPFFGDVATISTAKIQRYIRQRLKKVQVITIRKELSVLRQICAWSGHEVEFPSIGKRVTGTIYEKRRRVRAPDLSPAEIDGFLEALPEWSACDGWPVRARFVVAYETTLRPGTLDSLEAPRNYAPRGRYITLTRSQDKNRYGREVPLTARARAALDAVCPDEGLIFGAHNYREYVREAAKKALSGHKAQIFTGQHLRSAGITHLLERTGNLAGVQYQAGHKRAETTAKYVRATLRAAEDALGLTPEK